MALLHDLGRVCKFVLRCKNFIGLAQGLDQSRFLFSGVDGMVIMRIHYAWKELFAVEQSGDFLWQQRWDSSGKGTILCHNFPYDIYSVKGSCGPHAQVQLASENPTSSVFKCP